jgi:hypothetical protein
VPWQVEIKLASLGARPLAILDRVNRIMFPLQGWANKSSPGGIVFANQNPYKSGLPCDSG